MGKIKSQDQLLPFYLMDALGHLPGVPGLIVAGVFSASLSAISATMNSMTTVTVEDYIKVFVFVYGVTAIFTAFLAQYTTGILQASLTLSGMIGSPMLALFTLGMFFPSANEPGAIASIFVGLTAGVWLGFGTTKTPVANLPLSVGGCVSNTTILAEALPLTGSEEYFYLHRISYLWNVVISTMLAILVGYLVSWYACKYHSWRSPTDPDVYSPLVAYIWRKNKEDVDEIVIFEKNRIRESIKEEDEDENHLS